MKITVFHMKAEMFKQLLTPFTMHLGSKCSWGGAKVRKACCTKIWWNTSLIHARFNTPSLGGLREFNKKNQIEAMVALIALHWLQKWHLFFHEIREKAKKQPLKKANFYIIRRLPEKRNRIIRLHINLQNLCLH